ncbi:hypothetical protein ACFV98_02515 [Streptomyces violascens]|uniref:hypothetical protein n=1 Tax=Streptomyces violascens TaxID=67381 RepID=UPI00365D2BDB
MNNASATIKDSSQLAKDDIVLTHGMRVRLDEVTTREHSDRTVFSWTGTVLNLDEVREAGHIPMSFLRTHKWEPSQGGWVTDRQDQWTVQGNEFTDWLVETSS